MPYSRSFLPVCWFTCSTELKRRHGVNLGEVGVMLRRHIQTVRDALECESNELLGTDNELPARLVGPVNRRADFGPLTKYGPSANAVGLRGDLAPPSR